MSADVTCDECRLWVRQEYLNGGVSDTFGSCTLKLPPWVKDSSLHGQKTTASWDGCCFGQRAALTPTT